MTMIPRSHRLKVRNVRARTTRAEIRGRDGEWRKVFDLNSMWGIYDGDLGMELYLTSVSGTYEIRATLSPLYRLYTA